MNQAKALIVAVGLAGVGLGFVLQHWLQDDQADSQQRRDLHVSASIPDTEVQAIRETGFREFHSIESVFQLPSAFARAEAVYVLAGRSSGSEIQQLIFEADEISDPFEREQIIGVLFERLTEIDPGAAVATARIDPFGRNETAELAVWGAWARSDLDSAMYAVLHEPSIAKRSRIANALYRSTGHLETENAQKIEQVLGIEPSVSLTSEYVQLLAAESPAAAIAYINDSLSGNRKAQAAESLAEWLVANSAPNPRMLEDSFDSEWVRGKFVTALQMAEAEADPRVAIEEFFAGNIPRDQIWSIGESVSMIASTDVEAALQYYERADTRDLRQMLGRAIATEYAAADPEAAMIWARQNEHDLGDGFSLQAAVLSVLARNDPEQAFTELMNFEGGVEGRGTAIMSVLHEVGGQDPERAMRFATDIAEGEFGQAAVGLVFQRWYKRSPDQAVDWVLSQDSEDVRQFLTHSQQLVRQDVDTAIRILPRLPASETSRWRRDIANTLVRSRGVDEALVFARQFSDQSDYEPMLAGIARTAFLKKPDEAVALLAQIADKDHRDLAMSSMIQQNAFQNPEKSAAYLDRIIDPEKRSGVAAHVAITWYSKSSRDAVNWALSLPEGPDRDKIVVDLSRQMTNPSPEEHRLMDSVADPTMRLRIERNRILYAARSDPQKARTMLATTSLTDTEKRRIEEQIAEVQKQYDYRLYYR